jgi:hypothetical protein
MREVQVLRIEEKYKFQTPFFCVHVSYRRKSGGGIKSARFDLVASDPLDAMVRFNRLVAEQGGVLAYGAGN